MSSARSNLTGRVAIITGASSGIGAATARAFASSGLRVVLASRDEQALARSAAGLPGDPLVVPTDITDPLAVEALVDQTVDRFGGIDIVVNNAGVGLAGAIAQLAAPDLRQALEVDLLGPINLIQAVLPHMRPRPSGPPRPQIIQVSSVVALRALPYLGGYAGAKAALERVSEALRVELRRKGIVVTVVRPGTTATNFRKRRLGSGSEHRRIAPRGVPPERVAAVILEAAKRQPRVAYVSFLDRLLVAANLVAPGLVDQVLARTFQWQE